MEVAYKFKASEVIQHMNYVGECFKLGSQPAKTGRGKRLYAEMIPAEYEEDARKMIERCRHTYSCGIKNDVEMSSRDCTVLFLLCNYVSALYRDV